LDYTKHVLQAAEALGAIGAQRSVALLEQFAQDPAPEVSQTCQVCYLECIQCDCIEVVMQSRGVRRHVMSVVRLPVTYYVFVCIHLVFLQLALGLVAFRKEQDQAQRSVAMIFRTSLAHSMLLLMFILIKSVLASERLYAQQYSLDYRL
jgi:hypothetical protein